MSKRHFLRIFATVTVIAAAAWLSLHPAGPAPSAGERAEELAPHVPAPRRETVPKPATDKASLIERKGDLLRMDAAEARDWILRELDGGADYATGADLAIGGDQTLSAWPSYRVYLLDMLHLVDPAAAAAKSRELVGTSQSPDEWAVALRNVAKADEDGSSTEWLRAKSAELLRNGTWREDPSAGYLNAFDLIVYTEHTALSPELLALCDDRDRRAVRHASFLALDRLVQARPETVLPVLAAEAARHPSSGPMLSNLMARADLRDALQREAVERYLLDGKRAPEELDSFAGVFPNANFHVSNNLLTRTEGIAGPELAERDRAALEIVEEWLEDERFIPVNDTLLRIQSRLGKFLNE